MMQISLLHTEISQRQGKLPLARRSGWGSNREASLSQVLNHFRTYLYSATLQGLYWRKSEHQGFPCR